MSSRRQPAARGPGPVALSLYAAAFAWWSASWHLRNSALMAWLPFEPIWLGAGGIALCVVHRLAWSPRLGGDAVLPLLVLLGCMVPGAVVSQYDGYGPEKVQTMFLVLAPVVAAAAWVFDTPDARARLVWALGVVGVLVAATTLLQSAPAGGFVEGRLTLNTVDTISTARLIGSAVVSFLVLGIVRRRTTWWAWSFALVLGSVMVQIGSRGPLLSVVVAVLLLAVFGRAAGERRVVAVMAASLTAGLAYLYAALSGGGGGRRLLDSVQGDLADDGRRELLQEAVALGVRHPWGIGWGDFASRSQAGQQIANDQGIAYAHNVFAEFFVEGGVVALVALVVVLTIALWRARLRSGSVSGSLVLAALVYWLVNAQFSSDLLGNRILWVLLAVALASSTPAVRGRSGSVVPVATQTGAEAAGRTRGPVRRLRS